MPKRIAVKIWEDRYHDWFKRGRGIRKDPGSFISVYHNIGLLRDSLRYKCRAFYVHNTPKVRDTFAQLQKYGYIGNFIAVQEPLLERRGKLLRNKQDNRKINMPYLLVFNKYRIDNKMQPVIGGISWNRRPVAVKRYRKTVQMNTFRQGHGIEFIELEDGYFMPSHLCKLRNIEGYAGFRIWS